jgi:hypothetical protein
MVLAVINSRSMPRDFLARIRNQPTLLLVVTSLLAINFWFDYYHPRGILVDVIVVVALIVGYLRDS